MILAAHQPNYLPWTGYFHKMARCDVFVFMDSVQYARRSYTARCQYKAADGRARWLSVPVFKKGRYHQRIDEVMIDNGEDWQTEHQRTWESFYGRAPFFDQAQGILDEAYGKRWERLADMNIAVIRKCAARLGLQLRFVHLSELRIDEASSQLLVNACRALSADVYLSGPSGRDYLDAGLFKQADIELRFTSCEPRPYPQQWGAFAPGLSVLDLALNCGWDAAREHLKA